MNDRIECVCGSLDFLFCMIINALIYPGGGSYLGVAGLFVDPLSSLGAVVESAAALSTAALRRCCSGFRV